MSNARGAKVEVVSVFGALAVEGVTNVADGVVADHVIVGFWVNSCVGIEWLLEEDASVVGGWRSGKEK